MEPAPLFTSEAIPAEIRELLIAARLKGVKFVKNRVISRELVMNA